VNLNEYEKMATFEKDYWWHRGRLRLLDTLIGKYAENRTDLKILEVGCGTGENAEYLKKYGLVYGMDIADEAIKFCRERGLERIYKDDLVDIKTPELLEQKGKFDVILALDVLEHIQDDVAAMSNVKDLLGENGVFIATVPAHKFLWSEHDESLHHKRRYHSLEIKRKLADAGFEVLRKSYFIVTFFPIIVFYRFWNNIFGKSAYPKTSYVLLPEAINNFFYKLLQIEAKIIKDFDFPVGTTIVTVAKKLK